MESHEHAMTRPLPKPAIERFTPTPNPTFLEKQNDALLKALMKKDGNHILQMVIEQQRQILELSKKIGELTERDALRERQLRKLYWEVKANGR